MLSRAAILAGGVVLAALTASSANAAVLIAVDKSTQEMTIQVDGTTRGQWKVSTGRSGTEAVPLTLAPQPLAQASYRQAFLADAEAPAPPPSYPPFPRPWSVSSDLR